MDDMKHNSTNNNVGEDLEDVGITMDVVQIGGENDTTVEKQNLEDLPETEDEGEEGEDEEGEEGEDEEGEEGEDEEGEEDEDEEGEEGEEDEDEEDEDEDEEEEDEEEVVKQTKTSKERKTNKALLETVLTSQSLNETTDTDSDIEDDDDEGEDNLEKFDDDIKNNNILKYHHDILQSNYDEILSMVKVVRDKYGNVIDPLHTTLPILTKFEMARVLGLRAKQINSGAEPFIRIPENLIEGYVIAQLELRAKAIPYIITRPLPGGKKEYWRLQDLEIVEY